MKIEKKKILYNINDGHGHLSAVEYHTTGEIIIWNMNSVPSTLYSF